MKPTILEGDVVWENKLAYDLQVPFTDISLIRLGEPKRGDIVVFTSEKANKRLIKRLIGLPGDTIEVKNNHLFINGEAAKYERIGDTKLQPSRDIDQEDNSTYAMESLSDLKSHVVQRKPPFLHSLQNFHRITIPQDNYFFMGDNRDESADSRYYGIVPRSEIRGHATNTMMSVITGKTWKIWDWRFRSERFFDTLK
jgi:signal peptidase I